MNEFLKNFTIFKTRKSNESIDKKLVFLFESSLYTKKIEYNNVGEILFFLYNLND
jgi:hypothetical protein